jgi:hypothetical protein
MASTGSDGSAVVGNCSSITVLAACLRRRRYPAQTRPNDIALAPRAAAFAHCPHGLWAFWAAGMATAARGDVVTAAVGLADELAAGDLIGVGAGSSAASCGGTLWSWVATFAACISAAAAASGVAYLSPAASSQRGSAATRALCRSCLSCTKATIMGRRVAGSSMLVLIIFWGIPGRSRNGRVSAGQCQLRWLVDLPARGHASGLRIILGRG